MIIFHDKLIKIYVLLINNMILYYNINDTYQDYYLRIHYDYFCIYSF